MPPTLPEEKSANEGAPAAEPPRWTLAVHGGAGSLPGDLALEELQRIRNALHEALVAGSAVLGSGGTSLDAVQSAVRVLEDCGVLNAGRGAVLTHEGLAELDAALMDGHRRAAGAVGAVRHVANPIDLARAVMDHSEHVLLVGPGAEQFARERGLRFEPDAYFITERRKRELERVLRAHPQGTVGAVARDVYGNLAAGTSTGGLNNKHSGRVGDSPIIGAGTLADNGVCAVSATGHGEALMRYTAAGDVWARVKYLGRSIESAVREVIGEIKAAGAEGGMIAVDASGVVAMAHSSPTMLRGQAGSEHAPEVIVEVTGASGSQVRAR